MVDFQNKIAPHIGGKFADRIFDREDANDFYRYWSEKNDGGHKMRFEMQKTFEVKKRIVTWMKNKRQREIAQPTDTRLTWADLDKKVFGKKHEIEPQKQIQQ